MRSQLCIRYLIRIHVVGSVYMCAFLSLVFGWVRERESLGFELDAIQNILCIPIHESERPFKFHYDFQHLNSIKMNTNSLYGLAHSIYTYITKLLLSIVFWIFSRKKIKEVAKTRILPSFLFYFYNHFVSFPFSFCKQRSNRNIYRRYKQNIYDIVSNGRLTQWNSEAVPILQAYNKSPLKIAFSI